MLESTLTIKGQTTLPKEVREHLGLAPGDKLRYLVTAGEVRILKPRKAMSLLGTLKREGPPVSLEEMDAAVRRRAARRE